MARLIGSNGLILTEIMGLNPLECNEMIKDSAQPLIRKLYCRVADEKFSMRVILASGVDSS